jgi:hypothetical protein
MRSNQAKQEEEQRSKTNEEARKNCEVGRAMKHKEE